MNGPSRREDTRNVTLIAGAGLLGLVGTAAIAAALAGPAEDHARRDIVRVRQAPAFEVPAAEAATFEAVDRLYGHVRTRTGEVHTGLLRWDRNEASWADVLDAVKGDRTSGIRFGHLRAIEPTGPRTARMVLRSGGVVELSGDASDLGTGLRSLTVESPGSDAVRLSWSDLDRVEFEPAPPGLLTGEARLHGTLSTRSGHEFTGYLAWNVTDVYTTDALDARARGGVRRIRYHAIAALHRRGGGNAVAVLTDGSRLELRDGEDIGRSSAGVTVSDPGLGEVKVPWNELASVRLHPPETPTGLGDFDEDGSLSGTVVTEDGDAHTGIVVWDRDEAASWEMLHGSSGGIEFQVEFGRIAHIARAGSGALVELRDGRTFHLTGSNDVDASNQGILVRGNDTVVALAWRDFAELTLDHGDR